MSWINFFAKKSVFKQLSYECFVEHLVSMKKLYIRKTRTSFSPPAFRDAPR